MRVGTQAQLDALYNAPGGASLAKEADGLLDAHRRFVTASPFCVLATMGPRGIDCSPRGDAPGFVRVEDDGERRGARLLIPDRRGNNRIDTLRNLVENDAIGLIFLVPGRGEALRVAGRAVVLADADLCASFALAGRAPRTVIAVRPERVFHQCARAVMRSGLWGGEIDRPGVPSAGEMTRAAAPGFDAEGYDAALRPRQRDTLY